MLENGRVKLSVVTTLKQVNYTFIFTQDKERAALF